MTILDFVWSEAGVAAFNVLAYLQDEGGAAAAQTEDFTLWGMIQKMKIDRRWKSPTQVPARTMTWLSTADGRCWPFSSAG